MRISTKGPLSASAYAGTRLEMDAHIETMRRELYEAADEKVRDWYQEGTARLFSRVPDASKERAANLYEAVKVEAEGYVPFGVDPGDSAALLKLRQTIDDYLLWPSEKAEQDGDYELAVIYSGELAQSTRLPGPDLSEPEDSTAATGSDAEDPVPDLPPTKERIDLYVDDLSTLSPALLQPVPPADGVMVKTRGR